MLFDRCMTNVEYPCLLHQVTSFCRESGLRRGHKISRRFNWCRREITLSLEVHDRTDVTVRERRRIPSKVPTFALRIVPLEGGIVFPENINAEDVSNP